MKTVQNNNQFNGLDIKSIHTVYATIDWKTGVFYTFKNIKGVFDSEDFKVLEV